MIREEDKKSWFRFKCFFMRNNAGFFGFVGVLQWLN